MIDDHTFIRLVDENTLLVESKLFLENDVVNTVTEIRISTAEVE
jgi:hypothetical protein